MAAVGPAITGLSCQAGINDSPTPVSLKESQHAKQV